VQELDLIPLYVEKEIDRQLRLIEVAEELRKREAKVEHEIYDLTGLFEGTESKILRSALKKGGKVLAVRLPGFAGLLGAKEGETERRLGPEFAQYAEVMGVKGIFHSDELPAYGVSDKEVEVVRNALKTGDSDAFVLVAEKEEIARNAIEMVLKRAEMAFDGVPEETRDAKGDGKTKYSRPLPGKARMYPETDVPPIYIDDEMLDSIELPELREEKAERFVREYGISRQDAEQIVDTEKDDIFESLASEFSMPKLAVRALLQIIPQVGEVDENGLRDAFGALKDGRFSKEGLEKVLGNMAKGMAIDEAIESAGLGMMSEEEAMEIARKLVAERTDFVKDRGQAAMGPLMGLFMAQVRGKLDGKKASAILRKAIEEVL
jgi:glutamyl-tRNA(Gln) amidotransferase subunit E